MPKTPHCSGRAVKRESRVGQQKTIHYFIKKLLYSMTGGFNVFLIYFTEL